jgi:hypothetical protein
VSLLGGVAVAGGSVGFLVWNAGKISTAKDGLASTQSEPACDIRNGGFADQCNADVSAAQSTLDSANSRNIFGYVGLGVGALAAGLGVYLLVSNDDPHRYDKPHSEGIAKRPIVPIAWGDRRGGGVGLSGSF